MNFDATATYDAQISGVAIAKDGSATVKVKNSDANGNAISEIEMTIPAAHAGNVQHSRTGDTGLAVSQDLADAIDALNAAVPSLLSAVISNNKHAL